MEKQNLSSGNPIVSQGEVTNREEVITMERSAQNVRPNSTCGCIRDVLHRLFYFLYGAKLALHTYFLEAFTKFNTFDIEAQPFRYDDVAVITGGAQGIGYDVVKKLLRKGFRVFMGVRSLERGNLAVESIRKEGINTGKVECIYLDLTSLDSVRTFAQHVLSKTNQIHLLFNNAGIMAVPYKVTEDGMESQFQVNYASHFLLTNILLPRIIKTGESYKKCRIINTSSFAQYGGNLNFQDLQSSTKYSGEKAYFDSKLAQVLSTKYLNRKMVAQKAHVRVYSLHPGSIPTGLWDHLGALVQIIKYVAKYLFLTVEHGGQLVTYAALSPDLEDEGAMFLFNNRKRRSNPQAYDVNIQQKLWDVTLELVGISDSNDNANKKD